MPRYKLMCSSRADGFHEREVLSQQKNTKKNIEQWVEDNIKGCGLDWRSGYTIKFLGSDCVYTWRWIKDNSIVQV